MDNFINKVYSDFDLNFIAHPNTGNLKILTGVESVKQAIKVLVLTQYYERFQKPFLGSNVKYYLFENVDPMTALLIKDEIIRVITNYERHRVANLKVNVAPNFDRNGFDVTIYSQIVNMKVPVEIDLFLERLR